MPSSQTGNERAARYSPLTHGYMGPTQTPSHYYVEPEHAPHRRSTLLAYPQTEPYYEVTYASRPNSGLPEQGRDYNAYTGPAPQRPPAPLLRGHHLPKPATNDFYGAHAIYPPLTSGSNLVQQGSADSTTMRPAQPWIEIANGGIDLSQPLPSMGNIINNRDIILQFPDGTIKDVKTHGDVITLYTAAKVVQKWYSRNQARFGSLLKGFRVVNGVYVPQIV